MNSKIQELKNWRDDLAFKAGKPSYYILTNKNLEDALLLNPDNPDELKKLSGWGPRKIEKYGAEVLKIIRDEKEENQPENLREDQPIFSVSQYINFVNITLQQFGEIKVTGEINDLGGTERGLAFFDLKDKDDHESTMQCVIYRNNFQYLSHLLEEGLEVVVYGFPSIYSKNGNFKFAVTKIEPVGEGGYKKALEILRKKLTEKGYFLKTRKRDLPTLIKKVGLITSSQGAAIQDFKKNLAEFGFKVYLKNVYVEGDRAEDSILGAINFFNRQKFPVDILVMIRGGGSWESLKAYNSEKIVETVVASRIPIVTGIGHESDETFVGLSSDFDCSTPSIVATFLSRNREDLLKDCQNFCEKLILVSDSFLEYQNDLIEDSIEKINNNVEKVFVQFNQKSQTLLVLLIEKIFQINNVSQNLVFLKQRLNLGFENNLKKWQNFLINIEAGINLLNPKNILEKGYCVVRSSKNGIIDSAKKVKLNEVIKMEFRDGKIQAKIRKAMPECNKVSKENRKNGC